MRGQRAFAIVLLSPEDIGGAAAPSVVDPQRHRARQNVVLELGLFVGKLGRSRVCALKKGEVELPSDIAGVAYVDMDERGAWKSKLLKELANADYEVYWRRAMA